MTLETNKDPVTEDVVISKLMDMPTSSSQNAFLAKRTTKSKGKYGKSSKNGKSKSQEVRKDPEGRNSWYLDSGSSRHSSLMLEKFKNRTTPPSTGIMTANGQTMKVEFSGDVEIVVGNKIIPVTEVLYAPDCAVNLLSISRMCEKAEEKVEEKGVVQIIDEIDNETVSSVYTNQSSAGDESPNNTTTETLDVSTEDVDDCEGDPSYKPPARSSTETHNR
ncbi:Retrovirus-related Pol polyprotein from transposon RE2, partial [Pseudolycoriella hygida]